MIIMLFIPNKSKIDILYLVPSLCGVQLITSFHPVQFLTMHYFVIATLSHLTSHISLDLKCQDSQLAQQNENTIQFYISQITQFLKLLFIAKMRVSPLVTLGNVPRKRLLGYGPSSSSVLRQLVCKLKRGWKQTMGWRKRGPQYSYDFHSYCLNFSDGPSNDHFHIPP